MRVWFNPESRLKRIATITVDCGTPGAVDTGQDVIYAFDQAYAATGDWRFSYSPDTAGWPEVMADHFRSVTVPFIQRATSADAIVRMMLAREAPPHNGGPWPFGAVVHSYELARRHGRTARPEDALDLARTLDLDWHTVDNLRAWAARNGVPLELRDPPFSLRRAIDRYLPTRRRRYP